MESGQTDEMLTKAFENDVKYWTDSVQYWMDSLDYDLSEWNLHQGKEQLDKVNDTFEWLKQSIALLGRTQKSLERRKEYLKKAS